MTRHPTWASEGEEAAQGAGLGEGAGCPGCGRGSPGPHFPEAPQDRSEGINTVTTACGVSVCVILQTCAHVYPWGHKDGNV